MVVDVRVVAPQLSLDIAVTKGFDRTVKLIFLPDDVLMSIPETKGSVTRCNIGRFD
jgi:hypothetical protein